MSSLLVTGAAGFIGSHTVEAAVSQGHRVRAIDAFNDYYDPARKRANAQAVLTSVDVRVELLDLNSADLDELLDGVDVVVHLAGQPGVRSSWTEFHGYQRDNVLATEALLRAALRHQTARFVYASSSSVYGNAKRYPVTEEDLTVPTSPYGVTKLAGELLCRAYAENFGLSTVSLRYFTVYGPRQRPDMAMQRLIEAAIGGTEFVLFGDGSQVRDFTYVGDVVKANLAAVEADCPAGSVFNIAGGGSVSMEEVLATVERVTGRSLRVRREAPAVGDVRQTGGATDAARRHLGWAPTVNVEEGLRRQAEACSAT